MPTPGGLPQVGEVWTRTWKLPPDWVEHTQHFVVIQRGRGDYWSLRVGVVTERDGQKFIETKLWVDPADWFRRGELKYTGHHAGPKTKRKLGIG